MEKHTTSQTVTEWPRWMNLKQSALYCSCSVNSFKRHFVNTGRVRAKITDFGKRYDKLQVDEAIKNWY